MQRHTRTTTSQNIKHTRAALDRRHQATTHHSSLRTPHDDRHRTRTRRSTLPIGSSKLYPRLPSCLRLCTPHRRLLRVSRAVDTPHIECADSLWWRAAVRLLYERRTVGSSPALLGVASCKYESRSRVLYRAWSARVGSVVRTRSTETTARAYGATRATAYWCEAERWTSAKNQEGKRCVFEDWVSSVEARPDIFSICKGQQLRVDAERCAGCAVRQRGWQCRWRAGCRMVKRGSEKGRAPLEVECGVWSAECGVWSR